jgi:hypothetical protein
MTPIERLREAYAKVIGEAYIDIRTVALSDFWFAAWEWQSRVFSEMDEMKEYEDGESMIAAVKKLEGRE